MICSHEKPILFNTEMVRAILDGRKTVTRRVIKNNISDIKQFGDKIEFKQEYADGTVAKTRMSKNAFADTYAPYHEGDLLYVRETWCRGTDIWGCERTSPEFFYKADDNNAKYRESHNYWKEPKWHPSIHMPKEAARIRLKVTDVRAERLQEVMQDTTGTNSEIAKEGFIFGAAFIAEWNDTIPKKNRKLYDWDANPWVWRIEFKRVK